MAKTNFIFQRNWKTLIDRLPEAARLEVYEALIDHVAHDTDIATLAISREARSCLATILRELNDPGAFMHFLQYLPNEPVQLMYGEGVEDDIREILNLPLNIHNPHDLS